MKKLIIALFLIIASYAQAQETGFFAAGDTTETYDVANASVVYFSFKDSAMTGTDSLKIFVQSVSGGVTFYSLVGVHALSQTTSTTNVSLLIPGASAGETYAFYPASGNGGTATFTGTFFIARLNVNDNITPYLPKTRYKFWYSK
jgi:hypothetical protein